MRPFKNKTTRPTSPERHLSLHNTKTGIKSKKNYNPEPPSILHLMKAIKPLL